METILFSGSGRENIISLPTVWNSSYIIITAVVLITTIIIVSFTLHVRVNIAVPSTQLPKPALPLPSDQVGSRPIMPSDDGMAREGGHDMSIPLNFRVAKEDQDALDIFHHLPDSLSGKTKTPVLRLRTRSKLAKQNGTIRSNWNGRPVTHDILERTNDGSDDTEYTFIIVKPDPWDQKYSFRYVLAKLP